MEFNDEIQILSEKHKKILQERLCLRAKSVTARDIAAIRHGTLKKLEEIHSSKEFVAKMTNRVKLLYEMLFDAGFPKSKIAEKNIAAGLLYFISPADFLPDDIPGLGYLDDAFIINEVWVKVSSDIKKYLTLRSMQK